MPDFNIPWLLLILIINTMLMRIRKFNIVMLRLVVIFMNGCMACSSPSKSADDLSRLKQEVAIVDTLLRDPSFAEFMARSLDSVYYNALGQPQPVFLNNNDADIVQLMRLKDEKIATSIAPFYALECGVELLSKKSGEPFLTWLLKIIKGEADSNAVLLLNRFANATWKAGQPFRDMERLKRYNFRVAGLLSREETDKDSVQIVNSAVKLFSVMSPVRKGTQEDQLKFLRQLLQDTTFAQTISSYADSTYAVSQHQAPVSVHPDVPDTATVKKTLKQMKVATSLAGFYALECGLDYLVTVRHMLPSTILHSVANGSLSKEDEMLFARFANATWKAGQPFRGLNRTTRKNFTPFYYLSDPDIEKDVVQIKAAASILLSTLNTRKNL